MKKYRSFAWLTRRGDHERYLFCGAQVTFAWVKSFVWNYYLLHTIGTVLVTSLPEQMQEIRDQSGF